MVTRTDSTWTVPVNPCRICIYLETTPHRRQWGMVWAADQEGTLRDEADLALVNPNILSEIFHQRSTDPAPRHLYICDLCWEIIRSW